MASDVEPQGAPPAGPLKGEMGSDGGEVLEQPVADGPNRWLATIRDPAGNVVGIVQQSRG